MPQIQTDEYLNLAFKRHVAPENELDVYRNMFAIQGALVRGDVEVVLHNASTLHPAMKKRLRRMHTENTDHARLEAIEFWEVGKDDRGLSSDGISAMFKDVNWSGLRFEFVKILGAGSYGAATLWKIHLEGGITEKVVIKLAVDKLAASGKAGFNPDEEAYWHRRYHGSRHTVQIVDLASLAKTVQDDFRQNNPGRPLKYSGGVKFEAEDYDATVLEHMCHGDLFGILTKASFLGEDVTYMPDKVLWGIWECLVRGIAAVAYQPTFSRERDEIFEEELDRARQENRLGEFFDVLEKEKITHDVHFDLEESNILVGEASDHPNQPVFKLHDFGGFSCSMDRVWVTWSFKHYWKRRHLAKMTRLLPEQVHQDWDQISTYESGEEAVKKFRGEDLSTGHPIAGRYGSWSNVFIIAKTMEAVITLIYIAHPFSCKSYTTADRSKTAKTYGWRLNERNFQGTSAELRDIVCQCLFERPIDRPSIVALLRQIEARKEKGFGQTNAGVREYWEKLLAPQPERPIPYPRPVAPGAPQHGMGRSKITTRGASNQAQSTLVSTDRSRNSGFVDFGVQEVYQQQPQHPRVAPQSRAGPSRQPADNRGAQHQKPVATRQLLQRQDHGGIAPSSQHVATGYIFQRDTLNNPNSRGSIHPSTWYPPGYPPMDPHIQHAAFNFPPLTRPANPFKHPQGPYPGIQKQHQAPRSGMEFGAYRGVQYQQPRPARQQPIGRQHPAAQQGTNPYVQPRHPRENDGRSGHETGYMMLKFAVPELSSSRESSGSEAGVAVDGLPGPALSVIREAEEPPERPPNTATAAAPLGPRTATKAASNTRPKQASKVSKKQTGKNPKPKRKPSYRPPAIAAYVEKALPDMPVAIRNLWVRARQLDERLQQQPSWEM